MSHTRRLLSAVLLLAGTVSPALAGKPDAGAEPQNIVTVTYVVADLVVPHGAVVPPPTPRDGKPVKPVKTVEDELMKRLVKGVSPASWVDAGGRGSIDYFPLTMSLVVNQTPAVQEQVADWLTALRRLNDLQVVFEIRFVARPAETAAAPAGKVTYLDEAGLRRFLEVAQADPRTNLMQAPKMTLFNDQQASLDITAKETLWSPLQLSWENGLQVTLPRVDQVSVGTRASLHPVIAADQRSVSVDLDVELSALDSEPSLFGCQRLDTVRVSTTAAPKAGRTVMLDMGRRERKVAPGPIPFLSDLPVVGSLLREIGSHREEEQLVVLVTPRVIKEPVVPPASR